MKNFLLCIFIAANGFAASAQTTKVELFDLIKKLAYDSNGYENVGDWAVGNPKKFPVKWKEDRLIMSEDTSINFYRMGTVDITIKGRTFTQATVPVKWNIMLKGARSGYSSYSIISSASKDFQPGNTLDSLFGKQKYSAILLKSCTGKDLSGYYYYELKIPKKDLVFIKLSWLSLNGNTGIRIDCFDSWSKYAVKLDCPK